MSVIVDDQVRKNVLYRLSYLFWAHAFCIFLGLAAKLYLGKIFWLFPVMFVALFWCYKTYFKTLLRFNYTFWTFSFLAAIYCIFSLIQYPGYSFIQQCYILALVLLSILCYGLYSPIFYPRVTWWEYDFRYKGDIKIEIEYLKHKFPGRLHDLRKGAGCVVSFEKFFPGTIFTFTVLSDDCEETYEVRVVSRRETHWGRGLTYGVQFVSENEEKFKKLLNLWKVKKNARKRSKFKKVS